ncbi:MAG: hypothetical protein ACFFE8_14260 [Candidatus Heimdallarchaeota archaeon]
MKQIRRLGYQLFLVGVVFSSLFFASIAVIASGRVISPQSLDHQARIAPSPTKRISLEDLNFFDPEDLTNTSHQVNITRTIVANQYGYTSETIRIEVSNNGLNPIDAFNLTLPFVEYSDNRYLRVFSSNDTETEYTEWTEIETNNDSVVYVVAFPEIEPTHSSIITIQMDHPHAVTYDKDMQLEEATFPYFFNLSFIPMISLPITRYHVDWSIGKDKTGAVLPVSIDNETITPDPSSFTGTLTNDQQGIRIANVTDLATIDRTILNTTEYGNYNLTRLANLPFIPAYQPRLKANFTAYYLSFDYSQQVYTSIEFSSLTTKVIVSEWGWTTTVHDIVIRNIGIQSGSILKTALGSSTFPYIDFNVPETAHKIGFRDNYGNISIASASTTTTGKKIVQINPRVEIEKGEIYYLQMSYRERTSDIASDLGNGRIQLHLPLTIANNWTISQFEFNLLLPFGSTFNLEDMVNSTQKQTLRHVLASSTVSEREFLGLFNRVGIHLMYQELTPLSIRYVDFIAGLAPVYPFYQPLSIFLFLLILGIAYILVRNISFGIKPRRVLLEEIPLDLIRNFVKNYEEKTAVRAQILRLDNRRKTKKISAREYEKTRALLNNRMEQADRSIVSVSRKLAGESRRYRVAMRTIEVAEASREDILLNIDSLERKKTQGRIGKEAYAKLKLSYDKQLQSANNEIDKVLIELRALLTG